MTTRRKPYFPPTLVERGKLSHAQETPMSKRPAPERLVLSNLHLERSRGDSVKIFSTGGRLLCSIRREDWRDVAEFFRAITAPGTMI